MPEAESNRRGSVRELALSGGTVATTRVFDVATSYVFYIVLSRAVGVREFGALVLAMTVTQTAGVFARFGLREAPIILFDARCGAMAVAARTGFAAARRSAGAPRCSPRAT